MLWLTISTVVLWWKSRLHFKQFQKKWNQTHSNNLFEKGLKIIKTNPSELLKTNICCGQHKQKKERDW